MTHAILKDFFGSQDGRFTDHFEAGTEVELSDYLARLVVPSGHARPLNPVHRVTQLDSDAATDTPRAVVDNKAIATSGFRRGRKS